MFDFQKLEVYKKARQMHNHYYASKRLLRKALQLEQLEQPRTHVQRFWRQSGVFRQDAGVFGAFSSKKLLSKGFLSRSFFGQTQTSRYSDDCSRWTSS